MKRHIQKTGVRKFFGQDFIDLQAEPLRALDTFFAEYGACVIQGCELSVNGDGTYDVAAGLVAIEAADSETGDSSIKVMPFDGATGVALPLYLTAVGVVDERVYGDGRVKPIAVDFRAVASGVKPLGAHIVLSEAVSNRFVDVLQDDTHTFVSTAERARWNDILRLAKEYAKGYVDARETAVRADMAIGDTAASRSAIEYTDARERIVRGDMAAADVATLRDAKSYADQIVAALVDGSPELLNTLEELAGALGNDPNFATTVMTEIGKRVTTEAMSTALADKAATNHSHTAAQVGAPTLGATNDPNQVRESGVYKLGAGSNMPAGIGIGDTMLHMAWDNNAATQIITAYASDRMFMRRRIAAEWKPWIEMYHSGNFDPALKVDSNKIWDSGRLLESVDFNTILTPGTYQIETANASNTSLNAPVRNDYGTLTVVKGWSFITQIYYSRKLNKPFFRNAYDSSGWTEWVAFTNTRATDAADGLMAATDKGKLDAINDYQLLAAYWIAADGTIMRSFGSRASKEPTVRLSQGKIRIYHRARMDYIATVTPYGLESGGGRSVFTASIIQQRDNYTDIATADGSNGNLYNAAFNLTIHGHYLTPIF